MVSKHSFSGFFAVLSISIALTACSGGSNPDVLIETSSLEAGKPVDLALSIQNGNEQPFEDLQISHEKLLHLIVISADFREFIHLHPEVKDLRNAEFGVSFTPKKAGKYLIATDFANSTEHFSDTDELIIQGTPVMETTEADFSTVKDFGSYQVSVTTSELKSGEDQTLRFNIRQNGQPVTDLQPYLAAPMHFAIVKDDLSSFTHTHGVIPVSHSMEHSSMEHHEVPSAFGPDIEASTTFPEPGNYHVFGEFNHDGQITTIHFQFTVE